ncbi:MAG: hypothetical protein FD146_156 [Anaerolineaceae bacterium]|nr:MAG: hypothetical protein FD146_156 [Anaerolineaceae bacterium]
MLPDTALGSLKTTFGPNRANAKIILYVMPVFILVGLVFIGSLGVGSVVMWLIAAGLFWGYRAQMKAKVDVYEHGLAANDWLGRKSSFRWDEVAAVYEFIGYDQRSAARAGRAIQWAYTVHTKDGRRIKLDMAYETIRNLGRTVLAETGKLLLPAAQAAYKSGGTVPFGEQIGVSARGFAAGSETLAWADVEKMRFTRTADLTVHKKGQHIPWKLVMHNRIANFPVFQTLLHQAVKGSPPRPCWKTRSSASRRRADSR